MSDIKTLYDKVLTAQADIETVRNQINDALALGTPEGDEGALALEPKLDESIANEKKWHALYDKLASANESKGTLKHFIPVQAEDIPAEGETQDPKVINRAEFDKLDVSAKNAFVRGGGKVTDL